LSGDIKVKDEDLIGKRFKSNSCNDFTVLRKTSNRAQGDHGNYLYEIEFDEINGVRYRKLVRKEDILKGKPFNPYYPNVYGVGYIGDSTSTGNEYEYHKWNKMLSRCYNPNDPKYGSYGAAGVTVCDKWLCFERFHDDFKKLPGYKDNTRQVLDKDIRATSNVKTYSPETCMLASNEQNVKEMRSRLSPWFRATSPDGKEYISNCQIDFVREYGLDRACINDTLRGKQGQHRGWKFEYIDKEDL
jgi:hypothetical protein